MKYISKVEEDLINKFVANKGMVEAVKKVILYGFLYEGSLRENEPADPNMNFAIETAKYAIQTNPMVTDEMIGANLRANVAALRLIEVGFKELEKFQKVEEKVKKVNEAR